MLTLTDLALGVALPAIITFLVLAVAGQWWRGKEASPGMPVWAWPVALGIGYLVSHFGMAVVPNVLVGSPIGTQLKDYALPVTVEDRAGWVVLLLAAVAVVEAKFDIGLIVRWLLRIGGTAFACYLLVHPDFRMAEEPHEWASAFSKATALAVLMLLMWGLASDREGAGDTADRPAVGRLDTAMLAASTGAAAMLAGLSDSQKLAQYIGALAVVQAVIWGVHLFTHRDTRLAAATGPMAVAALWLTATAHLYASLTWFAALAIVLALVVAICPSLAARLVVSSKAQQAVRITLLVILLGSAVTAAGLQFAHDWNDSEASEWEGDYSSEW